MKQNRFTFLLLPLAAAGIAMLAGSPAFAQSCAPPPDGLVSWWTADGTPDDIGSNLHATLVGGARFGPGNAGHAFRLDGNGAGQDDRVDLPGDAIHGLEDLTVEFWIQTTETTEGAILSAAHGTERGSNELLLLLQPGIPNGLSVYLKEATPGRVPVVLNDGAWHHVAFSREGETGRLFVDGNLVDAATFPTGPLDVGLDALMLGQEQDCRGGCFDAIQAFDGSIDELAIYGRALADDEIVAIAESGVDGKCKPGSGATDDDMADRIAEIEAYTDDLEARVSDLEAYSDGLALDVSELLERVTALEEQDGSCDDGPHRFWRNLRRHLQDRHDAGGR